MNNEKITIRLPSSFIRQLDFLVKVEDFSSRSEAIRTAVRDMLYHRIDLVMKKIEKKVEANQKLMELEAVEEQYEKYLKK
jgi:Arc/MetJ-type ribon-helix-helix transcriptional regulator